MGFKPFSLGELYYGGILFLIFWYFHTGVLISTFKSWSSHRPISDRETLNKGLEMLAVSERIPVVRPSIPVPSG